MSYLPLTPADKNEMLDVIGAPSFDALLKEIPNALRYPEIDIPKALSELEIQTLLKDIGSKNDNGRRYLSFLGGGSYEHFIPAAVAQIASRQEFYTAYTPYQAEASQGTLQVIYEYQSLITELTGLDLSNASHYDGATSTAEAAILALRHTDRTKILVSRALHPHYLRVIKTYLQGSPYDVETFDFHPDGSFDAKSFESKLDEKVAGAVFQTPNFLGVLENLEGISDRLHQNGSLLIVAANPLSLGIFKSPGEWGADLAVGEGQPLGIPMNFGGPYVGYFAATRALMRRMPGRLAGITQDAEGRRTYCLTLQAREQHIRRERAASNICTNQALCALTACVYMTLLGKQGIHEVAEINVDRATYLKRQIGKLKGYKVMTARPVFNEFVVCSEKSFKTIQSKLAKQKIYPGIDLEQFYPEMKNHFLVCATETKTQEDLDRLMEALARC